jgi:hypothetical protein
MKGFAALLSILWRAVFLFPLALALFVLVLAYLFLPLDLVLYSLFVSPWYWITLPVWLVSIYLLRKPLRLYFKDIGESWL